MKFIAFTTRTMCFESLLLVQAVESPDALMCSVCASAQTAEVQHIEIQASHSRLKNAVPALVLWLMEV
jgi:hypothetical protein